MLSLALRGCLLSGTAWLFSEQSEMLLSFMQSLKSGLSRLDPDVRQGYSAASDASNVSKQM